MRLLVRTGRLRVAWAVSLAVLATFGLVLLGGCAAAPAEQRLRDRIAAMEAALEERESSVFMDGVAENFSGPGGADRNRLRGLLAAQMLRNAEIRALIGPLSIEMQDGQAQVEFEAVVSGGQGGLLPERARAYTVRSGWRDGTEGWQVVHASWEPRL